MNKIERIVNSVMLKIIGFKNHEKRNKILRKYFGYIGENCYICTNKFGAEPRWIYIENNVIVAVDVRFINHDASCWNVYRNVGLQETKQTEKVGSIILKNNCFIGAGSMILPNVVIGENSIVGAGSVVNKNIPSNEVWGGLQHILLCQLINILKK